MKFNTICLLGCCLWVAQCAPSLVRGDLVDITFRDQNAPTAAFPNSGGPYWKGIVDTQANTLSIYFWEEIPGSTEFWTPAFVDGPLVWPAVDSNGNPFDVPDSFGLLPQIGSNWGFVSQQSAREIAWNEGVYALPPAADYYPGWGAVRRPVPGQNPVTLVFDTASDQHSMPMLPSNAFGIGSATGAQVTVTNVVVTAVPEPSSFVVGSLLCAIALARPCARRLARFCRWS